MDLRDTQEFHEEQQRIMKRQAEFQPAFFRFERKELPRGEKHRNQHQEKSVWRADFDPFIHIRNGV